MEGVSFYRGWSLIALCLTSSAAANGAEPCKSPDAYENTFAVRAIRIDTPLQFLGTVARQVQELKSFLPLKERTASAPGLFTKAAFDGGIAALRDHLAELQAWPDARIAARLIAPPSLENCDEQAKTIDVVYRVYSIRIPMSLGHVVEGFGSQASRAVMPSATASALNQWKPRPFFSYDRTRRGYGGIGATLRGISGPVQEVDWFAAASSSAQSFKLAMAGSVEKDSGFISALDWRIGFRNFQVPALELRMAESILSAQVSAVTRAHGEGAFVGRFGAAIFGGHQRSEAPDQVLTPGDVLRSSTGAVKLFGGFSAQPGPVMAKASYGLQIGKSGSGFQVDYVKHVWDAQLSNRLPALRHRQFSIDADFGAGIIQRKGALPIVERFFGGGSAQPFLEGDSWTIRANPVIRSYPHNRLARLRAGGYLGGDKFAAVNTTFGYTAWGKPLTPPEVTSSADFPAILQLALSASRSSLYDSHLSETASFRAIASEVKPLEQELTSALAVLLRVIGMPGIDTGLKEAVERVRETTVKRLEKFSSTPADELDVRGLVMDIPADPDDPDDIPVDSLLSSLSKIWKSTGAKLEAVPGLASDGDSLKKAADVVATVTAKAQESFAAMEKSSAGTRVKKLADREMDYATGILDKLFKEVNLAGITPVMFLDAGRIWQDRISGGRLRYGVGGGLRLTFVALELTAGYAWNVHPQPWEGRGAFVLSLDVSSFLR